MEKEDFRGLDNLEELSLSDNRLKDPKPDTFEHLRNLKKLDLSCNEELEISDKSLFDSCANLKELNLKFTKIKAINTDLLKKMILLINSNLLIIPKSLIKLDKI